MARRFKTADLFGESESENDTQCERRRVFPRESYSTPRSARLGLENFKLATASSPFVSGYAASRTKQVYLYKWFLIRAVGNDPGNGINHNGVQVAIGGYTTSDLLNKGKFTTPPIESRIEKCKLRTVDGLNILLMGAIDEQCTYDNGFSFKVINLFLTGFPLNWNHVINVYFGQPCVSISVLSARKAEENADQQKDEALDCKHVGKQIKSVGTGKSSFQEPKENMSNITSIESPAECSKRGKYGMQPSVLSTCKGEDNTGQQTNGVLNFAHVGKQVESMEAGELSFQEPGKKMSKAEENIFNVTSPGESSSNCSKSGKCKMQPIRLSNQFKYDRLNMRCEPGTPTFVDSHEDSKDSVKGKTNVLKSVISQSIKENRVGKNQIDSRVFLDANKLTYSAQTVNKAIISESQTTSHSLSTEDGAKRGLINKETEQLPKANVLLEQLGNKCTSAGEQTPDIQIPALEVPETSCKKSNLRSKVKLSSKQDGRHEFPLLTEAILCDNTTVTECLNMNSDVNHATHLREIICTRQLDAENSTFDPKSRLLLSEITGLGINEKGHCEGNSSVSAGELGFNLNEDALSGSAHKLLCVVAENHIRDRSLKRGRDRNISKLSGSPCEQSKEFVSNQTSVMDNIMNVCNDINATRGSDPSFLPCEIQDDMTSKHCAEIGSNCLDRSGGKEEGCLYTQRFSTENNGRTSTKKSSNHIKVLPIPPRRVKTTPEEVSKAFGLKTSRSGRLIVPPLAHWCNQTVAYDMDGSLIAIFDGSSHREGNETAVNFKPPQEKDAVKIRRKLYNAANEIFWTPPNVKKIRKD